MHRPADVSARLVERCKSEQTFLLTAGDHTVPVRTTMIGDHHRRRLLAAAIGLSEGLELTTIVRGLEAVTDGRRPPRAYRVRAALWRLHRFCSYA